jgi:hypothetical protein
MSWQVAEQPAIRKSGIPLRPGWGQKAGKCTRCRLFGQVTTTAFFGVYLGRGRPSRSEVFILELFPGGRHFRVGDNPTCTRDLTFNPSG